MSVRQFKLINGYGQEFDITSTDYLFSSPSGLGYDRTESYRQIGNSFVRVNKQPKQGSITGKLIFTPPNAYTKYYDFIQFINVEPLKLQYIPLSSIGTFYRDVTVSKIEKSELTKYASLECSITFTCFTPWYRPVIFSPNTFQKAGNLWPIAWPKQWGQGNTMAIELDSDSFLDSPCRLVIKGEKISGKNSGFTNPSWTHYVNGVRFETGAITCSADEGQSLIIDNTSYPYTMKIFDDKGNLVRDVYSASNFSTERFLSIQNGHNTIAISNEGANQLEIRAEVYLQYETV